MIGRILRAVRRIADAENAEAKFDGATVTITGAVGSTAYAVTFAIPAGGALPARMATAITVVRTEQDASQRTVKIPLASAWWRVRAALFIRRLARRVALDRAREALGA